MHMVDEMVIGYRSLLAHSDPTFFGHALYFWSISDGTLLRKLVFNRLVFNSIHILPFFESNIKFIANRAFLVVSDYIHYS